MPKSCFLYILSLFFLAGCNDYTPRPSGFARIERKHPHYLTFDTPYFSLEYPSDAKIEQLKINDEAGLWFNIIYPQYNATLYCTYLPTTKATLSKALDDSYQLAYSHISMADEITQIQYVDSLRNKEGILYDIKGFVAVPLQFYITDKASHFLRGSFYFDHSVNVDSVSPVVGYIKGDIQHIMESLNWKNIDR